MKPQDEALFKEPSAPKPEREQQASATGKQPRTGASGSGRMPEPDFDDRPRREDDQLSELLNQEHPEQRPASEDKKKKG